MQAFLFRLIKVYFTMFLQWILCHILKRLSVYQDVMLFLKADIQLRILLKNHLWFTDKSNLVYIYMNLPFKNRVKVKGNRVFRNKITDVIKRSRESSFTILRCRPLKLTFTIQIILHKRYNSWSFFSSDFWLVDTFMKRRTPLIKREIIYDTWKMKKKIGHLCKKGSFNFKIDFKSSKKNEKCVTAF